MGNLLEKTDGDMVYTYGYDRAGRLSWVDLTRSGFTYRARSFTYCDEIDAAGGCPESMLGKLQKAISNNYWDPGNQAANLPITETYEYNGTGGAVSSRTTELPIPYPYATRITQGFTWSQLGALKTQQYPSLKVVDPSLDPGDPGYFVGTYGPSRSITNTYIKGWLTGVSSFVSEISYHENGMVSQIVHSNGVTDFFDKDLADMQRPRSIEVSGTYAGTWSTGDISYDGAGNITAMGSDWFLYDGISRLTRAHLADVDKDGIDDAVDIAYRYDPFGNRTDTFWSDTDEQGGLTTSWFTYSVDTATNRLSEELYDSSGNMTSLRGDTFTWYPFNQIQERTATGRNLIYGYTVDGERLLRWDRLANTISLSIRDLGGKVVREFDLEGSNTYYTWEKDYVHARGKLLGAVEGNGAVRHYHLDHLGTPRVITDASGNRIAYNAYSPYGIQLTGEQNERLKFTGHERDPGNLDYMHARYYSPIVSRFLSVDPAQSNTCGVQGWNRYEYSSDNPLKFIDTDGRTISLASEARDPAMLRSILIRTIQRPKGREILERVANDRNFHVEFTEGALNTSETMERIGAGKFVSRITFGETIITEEGSGDRPWAAAQVKLDVNAIEAAHPDDKSGVVTTSDELYHVRDIQNGKYPLEILKGDRYSSDLQGKPAHVFALSVLAEDADISEEDAAKLLEEWLNKVVE